MHETLASLAGCAMALCVSWIGRECVRKNQEVIGTLRDPLGCVRGIGSLAGIAWMGQSNVVCVPWAKFDVQNRQPPLLPKFRGAGVHISDRDWMILGGAGYG
jgi:hypothetical protein